VKGPVIIDAPPWLVTAMPYIVVAGIAFIAFLLWNELRHVERSNRRDRGE